VDTAPTAPRELSPATSVYEPPAPARPAPQQSAPEQSAPDRAADQVWPLWQRLLFRFFFVYLLLQTEPWGLFRAIPGMQFVLRFYEMAVDWAVHASNTRLFHVRAVLVPENGSGDTSWAWTQLWLCLSLAAVACIVWTILDRKRPHYERLAFWLRMIVRYYVAAAALSYGLLKLLLLQMPFPAISQLATPLGDLLPMRVSWLFIGYSVPYQFFSGAMETVAGLLLLYRRTVTAGLFAATGAFMNVVMINLSYDVPVKLYSSHLLLACLFLLALDAKRMLRFLVLNQPTPPTTAYDPNFAFAWQRWGSIGVKVYIVFQLLVFPLQGDWRRYQTVNRPVNPGPFKAGMYDVRRYVVNHDTVPTTSPDTLRWKDVIFDNAGAGSVNTLDQVFWQRYRRGYFRYRPDTVKHTVAVWKTSTVPGDSTFLFTMRYDAPDTNTIRFHTAIRGDSVHVELVRMPRHFQLAERQFLWVSEYNR
jgi:hypothetical protein